MTRNGRSILKLRTLLAATLLAAGSAPAMAVSADERAQPIVLSPAGYPATGKVDARFVSYNVEVASVIGGNFWRPYDAMPTSQPGAGEATADHLPRDLLQQRPPLDLSRQRLRNLAGALGPSYVRVSGTWANKVYFQKASDPDTVKAPPGFDGVLTRAQWKGVVDFARSVDAEILISFAITPGTRDSQGRWTPDQARELIEYTHSLGGKIAAAEFFNEPNIPEYGGAPAGYGAKEFARDHAIFETFVRQAEPDIRVVGLSAAFVGVPVAPTMPLSTSDLFSATPKPVVDVYSFHYYPAVSQRCRNIAPDLLTRREDALTQAWFAKPDATTAAERKVRDTYAPGAPIWVTESADAACGGNPWGPSFIDAFRYTDLLGRYAQQGVHALFHNTLLGSEYGLVDEETLAPSSKFWAATLWKRLMGEAVLRPAEATPDVTVYAHCHVEGRGGVTLAVINTKDSPTRLRLANPSIQYSLTAATLESRQTRLNGKTLDLVGDAMPAMKGQRQAPGAVRIPAQSITFLAIAGAGNPQCATPATGDKGKA